MIPSELTTNAPVARFVGRIREVCANRSSCAPPAHWLADSLRAEWARTPELLLISPSDRELIEREIRRGTNT